MALCLGSALSLTLQLRHMSVDEVAHATDAFTSCAGFGGVHRLSVARTLVPTKTRQPVVLYFYSANFAVQICSAFKCDRGAIFPFSALVRTAPALLAFEIGEHARDQLRRWHVELFGLHSTGVCKQKALGRCDLRRSCVWRVLWSLSQATYKRVPWPLNLGRTLGCDFVNTETVHKHPLTRAIKTKVNKKLKRNRTPLLAVN